MCFYKVKLWLYCFVLLFNCFNSWAASSEFGTYRLCEQRRFRRACASAQSRQNLRCSLIQAVNQEEPSDRKPDPWPLWMAGHAQLKFVMTECSKTQIRLTGLSCLEELKVHFNPDLKFEKDNQTTPEPEIFVIKVFGASWAHFYTLKIIHTLGVYRVKAPRLYCKVQNTPEPLANVFGS